MKRRNLLAVTLFAFVAIGLFAVSANAQVVYQSYYAPASTAYYTPSAAYYTPLAPRTAYYAPNATYYAPTTAYYAPQTTYYAPAAVAPAPVVTSYYRPLFGGSVSRVRYVPAPVTYYAPY